MSRRKQEEFEDKSQGGQRQSERSFFHPARSAMKQESNQKSSACLVMCFAPICVRKEKEQLSKQAQQMLEIIQERSRRDIPSYLNSEDGSY